MKNLEQFDENKKNMGQKTTDEMVRRKHDCLVVILCQKHMSKHSRVYSLYRTDIGSKAFKQAFVTHRNAISTPVNRMMKMIDCDGG